MKSGAKDLLALAIVMSLALVAWGIETLRDGEPAWRGRSRLWWLAGGFVALALMLSAVVAFAHDEGQWTRSDPAVRDWYQSLMQPDNPGVSCCGEADAYWADEIHIREGRTYAVVTDQRDDAPLHRPHVDVGTEIEIPNHKLKWDRGNPTGHGVPFLSRGGYVYCFVQPGGV